MRKIKQYVWQGNGGVYELGEYTLNRLSKIAGTNQQTFDKHLKLTFNNSIDEIMYFYLNRPDTGICLWCGKEFKYKQADLLRTRDHCCDAHSYRVKSAMVAMGEVKPTGCKNCVVCGKEFPYYTSVPFTCKTKTCDNPDCDYTVKYRRHAIEWKGKSYLRKDLVEISGWSDSTLRKRIETMGVDRAMTDEKTPWTGAVAKAKIAEETSYGTHPSVRGEKCYEKDFETGRKCTCMDYDDCWFGEGKKCTGFRMPKMVDRHSGLGNQGKVISRGLSNFGGVKSI